MNSIFHHPLRKFIPVFFDDILVYSPTWELYIEHVRTTLDIRNLFETMDFWVAPLPISPKMEALDGMKKQRMHSRCSSKP